jgi:hypothetical protein
MNRSKTLGCAFSNSSKSHIRGEAPVAARPTAPGVRRIGSEQSFHGVGALKLRKIKPPHPVFAEQVASGKEDEFGLAGAGGTDGEEHAARAVRPGEPQFSAREDRGGTGQDVILSAEVGAEEGVEAPQVGDPRRVSHGLWPFAPA